MKKSALLITALITGMASALAHSGVIIHGEITDETGKSIRGVSVKITSVCTNQETKLSTSANSDFVFEGPYCGTYVVEAQVEGYENASTVVEIQENNIVEINLKLKAKRKSPERQAQEVTLPESRKGTGFETPFDN